MKGVSPLISAVILLVVVFGSAALITPWMLELSGGAANQTAQTTTTQMLCQNMAYDFDTSFGSHGVTWNFTELNDTIQTKITNTGGVNIIDFSFEITVWNETAGMRIFHFEPTSDTQVTNAAPMRPGQSTILDANITQSVEGALRELKILNSVCPSVYALNPYI